MLSYLWFLGASSSQVTFSIFSSWCWKNDRVLYVKCGHRHNFWCIRKSFAHVSYYDNSILATGTLSLIILQSLLIKSTMQWSLTEKSFSFCFWITKQSTNSKIGLWITKHVTKKVPVCMYFQMARKRLQTDYPRINRVFASVFYHQRYLQKSVKSWATDVSTAFVGKSRTFSRGQWLLKYLLHTILNDTMERMRCHLWYTTSHYLL